jgi:hypothetical protein
MYANYDRAARKALETLIKYNITASPVSALPILKRIPNVIVISFDNISRETNTNRAAAVTMFGENNQDAVTSVDFTGEKPRYIVTYNQQLPLYIIQRALARELAHIVLKHDGSLSDEERMEETKCFAYHFLCPRPLIHTIQAAYVRLTTSALNNLTGCDENSLVKIRSLPVVRVAPELNRIVRDNFMDYAINFINFQRNASRYDMSAVADLGSYMDGYEE